ncbi:MAG: SGNH/GDSL hydrolase family protein [Weissella confusa]
MTIRRIVALGDSITQGWDGNRTVESWWYETARRLNISIDSVAVGGSTMSGSNYGHNFVQQANQVNFANYDAAIIMFGTNDFAYYSSSLQSVKDSLSNGLNIIRRKNRNIQIFGLLPIENFRITNGQGENNSAGYSQNQLMDGERQIYQAFGIPVLDWRGNPVVKRENRYSTLGDKIVHPTAATYVQMGDRIASFVLANERKLPVAPKPAPKPVLKPAVARVVTPASGKQFLGQVHVTITTNNRSMTWKYGPIGIVVNPIMINFSAPFSNDDTPSVITVDLFNLSPNSVNFIRKGSHVVLSAGYDNDIGVISEGDINFVYPRTSDSNGEIKSSFAFIEGPDYSKKTNLKLSLNKGISAKDAINRISSAAGIPLSEVVLMNWKTYSDGYSVDGSPLDAISEIATDAGSSMYYKRGRIVINDVKNDSSTALVYDSQHGLIGYPQPIDWDNSDDFKPGFSVELFLNHRINVGQAIKLDSKFGGGGIYHFMNGEHSFDGENFRTTGDVI